MKPFFIISVCARNRRTQATAPAHPDEPTAYCSVPARLPKPSKKTRNHPMTSRHRSGLSAHPAPHSSLASTTPALTPPTLPRSPTNAQHSHACTHRSVSCPVHGLFSSSIPLLPDTAQASALTPPLVTHLNNARAHARRHSHSVLQSCLRCQCSPLLLPLGQSFYGGVASACTGRHTT